MKQIYGKEYVHQTIDKDLDVRETWACIRELTRPYKPIPYAIRRKGGTTLKIRDRAEAAVQYFEQEIWNNPTDPFTNIQQ